MDAHTFDALTHRAAAGSRRRSLLKLGGTVLAATLARPSITTAAKKAKNKKKCNSEKRQCREDVQEFCGANPSCLDSFLQCCDTCKVGQGVNCVLNQP